MIKNIFFIGLFVSFFSLSSFSQSCITINQQPENQLTLDVDDIILTVAAVSSENLSFKWQLFDPDTDTWTDLVDDIDYSGTNTNTLTITNITRAINDARFRVILSGQSVTCTLESNEALITFVAINVNNLFTPNGDGINELFTIQGLSRFPNNKLQIYNRWGNLIHEKVNYQNDWDGTATSGLRINGSKKVPSGTYFYTINLNFDNKKISGWLFINR